MPLISNDDADYRGVQLCRLFRKLGQKMQQIETLSRKIGFTGPRLLMRGILHARLTKWLMQLALLRKKENQVLNKIIALEEKHQKMRRCGLLPLAKLAPAIEQDLEPVRPSASKRRSKLLKLLLLLMLLNEEAKHNRKIPKLTNG